MMSVFKNPVFIISCVLFWVNQLLEKIFNIFIPFAHAYLDDLLSIPVILGITLQIFRWIHSQKEHFEFSKTQLIVGVAYITFLFEILLPMWSPVYTADIWDVLCYMIGAVIFYKYINSGYK